METSIHARDVIGRDPFGRFLYNLKLKPWQAALASFSIFLIYLFALPAYFGVLFPKQGFPLSSIVDGANLVGFLLIHPVVIFFYVWQPQTIAGLYHLVLPLSPASLKDGLLRVSRVLHNTSRTWYFGVVFGLGVVYLGVIFVAENLGLRWYSYNWLMVVILQLSRFFLFYMIIVILARHLIMAYNLNRVYHHVKLPVLIAESKYGVSFDAITRYGLGFAGFGGVLGLFIAMRFFFFTPVFPEDAIYLVFYLILIPLAFSLPFWQAHTNMRLARLDALSRISNSLQDEYDRLMVSLSSEAETEISSDRIVALRSMLELTEKAPTWPFENWALYRVLAAVIFPFFMTGLGFLLDLFF